MSLLPCGPSVPHQSAALLPGCTRRFRATCTLLVALALASCAGPEDAQDAAPTAGVTQGLAAAPGLVITEVMADPAAVSDDGGEWLEVHNPGADAVDLEGWVLTSANDAPHTIAGSVVIPPGAHVVLGRSADPAANGGAPVAYAYGAALTLANSTDWVGLQDPEGRAVDHVAWTSRAPTGASRALINPACDNSEASGPAWKPATVAFGAGDLGTPGAVNSAPEACPPPPPPLPHDVRITEVMADPSAVADAMGEWFEVHNPGHSAIDLQGWRIASRGDAEHVIAASVVVPAGGYIVLGNNANLGTNGGAPVAYAYGSGVVLANSSDWLALRRPEPGGDVTIDQVSWAVGPSGGTSRALVRPGASNASDVAGSAWTSSTDLYGPPTAARRDRGTPGAPNPAPRPGISVLINDPARLPVGYVKAAFPTVRDADGAVVSPTPPLTWTSSDPAVATVDSRGYVSGLAEGTALIRATLADGTSGAAQVTVVPAEAPTPAVYRDHVAFGVPTDATPGDELLLARRQYTVSYNAARGGPSWVSWNLNATQFGSADRCNCFTPDPALPPGVYRVEDADYRGSGYDRGHLVQSYNRTTTEQENATTFLMTNIVPQAAESNQGPWSRFEAYLNALAQTGGREVYVIAGGAYPASPATLKGEGRVAIPDYLWKVAVVVDAGEGVADVRALGDLEVLAVWMPNRVGVAGPASADGIRNHPWQLYETTVDAIEAATGYDLLARLPDTLERIVEARDRPPVAHLAAPAAALEGGAVVLDASGSTDPDGDPLTYHWSFGDGGEGSGVAPVHAYADDGTYTVTLTVSDPYGATSTARSTVTISNVAPRLGGLPSATLLPHERYTGAGTFSDPGQDTWVASVDYGDGAGAQGLALAGTAFALSHTYGAPGTYTVTVAVQDDDGGADTQAVQVVVLTPQQALLGLEALTREALQGRTRGPEARSLLAKLEAARRQLDRGHQEPARNQLHAFVREVHAMERSEHLAGAEAQQLTGEAERVLRSIG